MANRTVKDAHTIHGTNPQYLVEKIIRSRIYECKYWKEECFALSSELLVDKAMELKYVGGVVGGNIRYSKFHEISVHPTQKLRKQGPAGQRWVIGLLSKLSTSST